MNICQLLLLYLLLINGMLIKVEAVNKKLQKSFTEIFGEGWDEEERREEIGKVTGDWQNDDKQIGNNDQRKRTVIGDHQQQATSPSSWKTDQDNQKKELKSNDQLSEIQKREIIRKWHAIKERIKQRKGKQSRNEWHKMEKMLAKKLGTNRYYIYKWIREMGMRQIIRQTNEGRLAIIKQYWEMKRKDPKMSDAKIAKALQISEKSISRWKGQFREELGMGMKSQLNVFTEEQKREIVRAFKAIKEKIKQKKGKRSSKEWIELDCLLAKKLGTNRSKIYKWCRELAISKKKKKN